MKKKTVVGMIMILLVFSLISCVPKELNTTSLTALQLITPKDDTTEQPITGIEFTWKVSTDANNEELTYNFYYGVEKDKLTKENESPITETKYKVTRILDYETKYYWQIEAVNKSGKKIKSVIRTFKTVKEPIQSGYMFIYADGMLVIYDIKSDPTHPVFITSIDLPHFTENFYFDGTYLYTTSFAIIDLSNPTNPKFVFNGYENSYDDIYVSNGYAYLAVGSILKIFDITDKTTPKEVGVYDDGRVCGVYVEDNYAYVLYRDKGFEILNVTDKTTPTKVGSYYSASSAKGIYVKGNYAYIADWNNGLKIVDITDKTTPKEVKAIPISDVQDIVGIKEYNSGTKVVFLATYEGLKAVDITSISNAALIEKYFDDFKVEKGKISGNYAYVTGKGFAVVDISNQNDIDKTTYECDDPEYFSYKSIHINGYDIVAAGASGMIIYDEATKKSYSLSFEDSISGVCVEDNYAYLVTNNKGFKIVDITDKTSPEKKGIYSTSGNAYKVYVEGNYAFIPTDKGLEIIDITDKANPTKKSVYEINSNLNTYGADVKGNYAYLATSSGVEKIGIGVEIIDITDKANPTKVGIYDNGGASNVYVEGEYAYVISSNSVLEVVDITDKANPTKVGVYDDDNSILDIIVKNGYAYIADRNKGLVIVDVTDPTMPKKVKSYDYDSKIVGINLDVDNNRVYLLSGESFMQVDVTKDISESINWKIPLGNFGAISIW